MQAFLEYVVKGLVEHPNEVTITPVDDGLDVLPELALHTLIADGLGAPGFGVLREQPYPHEWFRKLKPAPDERGGPGLALPLPRPNAEG